MEPPDSTNSIYRLAFDLFTDRVYNYVGSYYLKLDGQVDALVFAGGVGERSKELREVIAGKIRCLGFSALDPRKNAGVSEENKVVVDVGVNVTTEGDVRGKKILLCRTDEQVSSWLFGFTWEWLVMDFLTVCSLRWPVNVPWIRNSRKGFAQRNK